MQTAQQISTETSGKSLKVSISFSIHDNTDQLCLVIGKGLCKKSPVEACETTGDFS